MGVEPLKCINFTLSCDYYTKGFRAGYGFKINFSSALPLSGFLAKALGLPANVATMNKFPHSSVRSLVNDELPSEFLESFGKKLKVIAALTVPCTISLIILALDARDWYSETLLRNIVVNYHVFVAPIFQILSTILAGLQLYVVFTIFEYSARTCITQMNISLNTLRLWSALSSRSLNLNS
jgi:hypothetical protein